jgi:DNA-binding transcriptional ArsR family regulator
VGDVVSRARTVTNFHGMYRWGYVRIVPPAGQPEAPKREWIVDVKPGGRMAQQVWRPLFAVIEQRWRERFGGLEVDALRKALAAVVARLDPGLPDCMPILGFGLTCRPPSRGSPKVESIDASGLALPSLLSRVLLAFALAFEEKSVLSLAIRANPLRVLDAEPTRVRDLPVLTGVSKESLAMAMGVLNKARLVDTGKEGAWKVVSLTGRGLEAQRAATEGLARLESAWAKKHPIAELRAALEPIVGNGTRSGSLLFQGLEPYPNSWRAMVRRPEVLPHFPMVLHRGGFPDGS